MSCQKAIHEIFSLFGAKNDQEANRRRRTGVALVGGHTREREIKRSSVLRGGGDQVSRRATAVSKRAQSPSVGEGHCAIRGVSGRNNLSDSRGDKTAQE